MLVLGLRARHGDAGARARGPERGRLQHLGVATSGSTLFRQIGGSIGVSLFGAIFANRLAANLVDVLPPGVRSAGRRRPGGRRRAARRACTRAYWRRSRVARPGVPRGGACRRRRVRADLAAARRCRCARRRRRRARRELRDPARGRLVPRARAALACWRAARTAGASTAGSPSARGVDLGPAELWLLARLGEGAAVDLATRRLTRPRSLAARPWPRRGRRTSHREGERVYARVVAARRRASRSCSRAGSRRSTTRCWSCSTGSPTSSSPRSRPFAPCRFEHRDPGSALTCPGSRRALRHPHARGGSDMSHRIAVIPGDGVGPEVVAEARKAVDELGLAIEWSELAWGSAYYRENGSMMPADGLDVVRSHDALLLGAVGDRSVPDHVSLWGLLLSLRQGLDLWANIRPARLLDGVPSPLAARRRSTCSSSAKTRRASIRSRGARARRSSARGRGRDRGLHTRRRPPGRGARLRARPSSGRGS